MSCRKDSNAFGTGMLPIIFINLFIGYLGRGFIDNAAHLGGLVSGAILALAVDYRRPGEKPVVATTWRVLQAMAIALVALSFVKTAQHYRDAGPPSFQPQTEAVVDDKTQQFLAYAKAMRDAPEAFYLMLKEHDATRGDAALKELEAAPELDATANELKDSLKELLIKAKQIETNGAASSTRSAKNKQKAEDELMLAFVEWNKRYNTWLKTAGRQYGLIEVTETPSPGQ
jgi:hypothetical protein